MDEYGCMDTDTTEEDALAVADALAKHGSVIFPLHDCGTAYIISMNVNYKKLGIFPWGGRCDDGDCVIISVARRGMFWFDINSSSSADYYTEKLNFPVSMALAVFLNRVKSIYRQSLGMTLP